MPRREYCAVCNNLDPSAPLSSHPVCLRNPLGNRTAIFIPEDELKDLFGTGRSALLDRPVSDVRKAADTGCIFCDLLCRAFAALEISGIEMNLFLERDMNPRLTVWDENNTRYSFELAVPKGAPQLWKMFQPLCRVSQHPKSPEAMSFLTDTLYDCVSNHKDCTSDSFMPLRLIDVGTQGNDCRLIPTDGLDPKPYIAISYCWGRIGSQLTTTSSTISDRESRIPIDQLPKAVVDAVWLVRKLGVKYMWLDALCIIQDDHADWSHHVSQMSDVYRSANLVIAAGSSSSSGDSFLDTGDRKQGATIQFTHQGRVGDIYCAPFPASGVHDDYRGIYGSHDPVFRRAWTLQECILPTRLVVFSSTELQWICREHMVCEAGHRDSNKHHYSIYSIKEPTDAYHYWHNQVMEYTRRRMTLEKDKLPALAGVAVEICKITRGTYIGGVWKQNLIYDLCWERYLWEVEPFVPMGEYRAPTFSWASVGGNVFYNDDAIAGGPGVSYPVHYTDGTQSIGHTKYYSTLLEAKVTPLSKENPFGEIIDGFVRIQGPVVEALIYDHKDTRPGRRYTHTARFKDAVEEFDFHCDIPLGQYALPETTDGSASKQQSTTALRAPPGKGTPVQGAKVWLLNIGYFPHRYNNPVECPYVWLGLVILGKSRKPGAFERIGYKNLMWPPAHSTWPHRELDKLRPFATGENTLEVTII